MKSLPGSATKKVNRSDRKAKKRLTTSFSAGDEEEFKTPDELLNSCAIECAGKEIEILSHRTTARALISIVYPFPEIKMRLLQNIVKQKQEGVLTLLMKSSAVQAMRFLTETFATLEEPMAEASKAVLLQFCELILNHFDTLFADRCGTFSISDFGKALCKASRKKTPMGHGIFKTKHRQVMSLQSDFKISDPERLSAYNGLACKVLDWKAIKTCSEAMSRVGLFLDFIALDELQGGVHLKNLVHSIISDNKQTVFLFMCNQVGSNIFQQIIYHCSKKDMKKIFDHCTKGNMATLATDPYGNYCAQTFMECSEGWLEVHELADDVFTVFDKVWFEGRFGVIARLSQIVIGDKDLERKFVKHMLCVLNCNAEKEDRKYFLHCLLNMSPLSQKVKTNPAASVQAYGVDIALNMMNYSIRKTLTNSLLLMKNDLLAAIAAELFGSYVIQSVFQSTSLPGEYKSKVFQKLNVRIPYYEILYKIVLCK
ncbi:unnamed protein product [Soboliphyme baturini]|uniref:PUM-HD domain-containing protein n=1 Tax=Soboliphyme baturini TaxID=241478 RepID=A0A183IG92_9BILA|nr:unnamed protein product [Soboliphyme baturini]